MVCIIFYEHERIETVTATETSELINKDLNHIVQNVYALCKLQHELIEQTIKANLTVAQKLIRKSGGIEFSRDSITWKAVNQYTKEEQTLRLPEMYMGDSWLGRTVSMEDQVPVVEELKSLVGGTCAIFQRMNDQGDMLRLATNVEKSDQNRAIGT